MSSPPPTIFRGASSRLNTYHIEHRPESSDLPIMTFPMGPLKPLAQSLEEMGERGELVVVGDSNQRVIVRWPLGLEAPART